MLSLLFRGERGYALILLQPHEAPYADLLRAAGLTLSQRSSANTLCRLSGAGLPHQALGLGPPRGASAPVGAPAAPSPLHPVGGEEEEEEDDILGVTIPTIPDEAAAAAEQRSSAASRLGLDADDPALLGVDLSKFTAFGPSAASRAEAGAEQSDAVTRKGDGRVRGPGMSRLQGLIEAAATAAARVKHHGGSGGPGAPLAELGEGSPAVTRSAEMQVRERVERSSPTQRCITRTSPPRLDRPLCGRRFVNSLWRGSTFTAARCLSGQPLRPPPFLRLECLENPTLRRLWTETHTPPPPSRPGPAPALPRLCVPTPPTRGPCDTSSIPARSTWDTRPRRLG